jgi:hypothetical protein
MIPRVAKANTSYPTQVKQQQLLGRAKQSIIEPCRRSIYRPDIYEEFHTGIRGFDQFTSAQFPVSIMLDGLWIFNPAQTPPRVGE